MKNACLIILPAYNVESNLPSLLEQLSDYRKSCLFIDDGSEDHTPDILRNSGFSFVSNAYNQGVSASILAGLNYAIDHGYEKVILMDADGQHSPLSLPLITDALESSDFVFTTRFFDESLATIPSSKLTSNMLASCLFEVISGVSIPDVSCGFKGFKVTTDLIKFLEHTSGYSIIYKIVCFSLLNKKSYRIINTPAIYHYDSLLFTRASEMDALLSATLELADNFDVSIKNLIFDYSRCVRNKESFDIYVSGIHFHLFFISEYNGYIIQAPIELLRNRLLSNHVL